MIALLLPLLSTPAQASCGLDHCPLSAAPGPDEPSDVRLQQRVGALGRDYLGAVTSETTLGASARLGGPVLVGGALPFVAAFGEVPAAGLGDALVWTDLAWTRGQVRFGGGLQVEMPTATARAPADAHLLFLPHGRLRARAGRFDLGAQLGLAQAVETRTTEQDDHHHAVIVVDPHADTELKGRIEAGVSGTTHEIALRGGVRAEVIREAVPAGRTLGTLGPVGQLTLGRVMVQAWCEVPFTRARNRELLAGSTLSVGWGTGAADRGARPDPR